MLVICAETVIQVPNAGIGEPQSFFEVTFDQAGKPRKPALSAIQVNFVGVMYSKSQAVLYRLRKHKSSHLHF